MATVTVKISDTTKVGKSLINIASELASKYKSISILGENTKKTDSKLTKAEIEKEKFLKKFEHALIEAKQIEKEIKEGKRKGLTEKELFDELF